MIPERRRPIWPEQALLHAIMLLLVCLVSLPDRSPAGTDPVLALRFQRALDSVRTAYAIQGMSAAVLLPGQGTWVGTTGFSTFSPPDSIRPEMLFSIASNTKSFVGALMLRLVEEGKVALDDSIGRYLPPFPNVPGKITIRQLMNHTSGLYSFTDNPAMLDSAFDDLSRSWTPEEILSYFVLPPLEGPGRLVHYSNTDAIVAGMIVRNVGGASLGTQFRQRIFTPLGLQHSFFPAEDSLAGPIAHPWEFGLDFSQIIGKAFYSLAWATGGIYATAEDLVRWTDALYTGKVLSQASMTEMMTAVPLAPPGDGLSTTGYGLFVFQCSLAGRTLWGHAGESVGYLSWSLFDPLSKASVAVLLNVVSDPGRVAVDAVAAALVGALATTAVQVAQEVPAGFLLEQNYPNPFNPSTTIRYAVPGRSHVTLTVYDVLGRQVAELVHGEVEAGRHEVKFNPGGEDAAGRVGHRLASGVYYYRLQAGTFTTARSMMLLQ